MPNCHLSPLAARGRVGENGETPGYLPLPPRQSILENWTREWSRPSPFYAIWARGSSMLRL